jgi:hypothetical protein
MSTAAIVVVALGIVGVAWVGWYFRLFSGR